MVLRAVLCEARHLWRGAACFAVRAPYGRWFWVFWAAGGWLCAAPHALGIAVMAGLFAWGLCVCGLVASHACPELF